MRRPVLELKCESDHISFDQRAFKIVVHEETAEAWVGVHHGTPEGSPLITWPKFAWKRVEKKVCKGSETGAPSPWAR